MVKENRNSDRPPPRTKSAPASSTPNSAQVATADAGTPRRKSQQELDQESKRRARGIKIEREMKPGAHLVSDEDPTLLREKEKQNTNRRSRVDHINRRLNDANRNRPSAQNTTPEAIEEE